jgi:hypothetical protein
MDQRSRLDDDGHSGGHTNDFVVLKNAHPHIEHSNGYDADHSQHENHGIMGFHVAHSPRDKQAEHHPPAGLWEPNAADKSLDAAEKTGGL